MLSYGTTDLKQSDSRTLDTVASSNIFAPTWHSFKMRSRLIYIQNRLVNTITTIMLILVDWVMFEQKRHCFPSGDINWIFSGLLQVEMQHCGGVHYIQKKLLGSCKQQKWLSLSDIINLTFTSNPFFAIQRVDLIIQPGSSKYQNWQSSWNIPFKAGHSFLSPKQVSDNKLSLWKCISHLKFNRILHLYANMPTLSCV